MSLEEGSASDYATRIPSGYSSHGRLEKVLRSGGFAVTTELAPPDSAHPEEVYRRARVFDPYVDAINATDGSGANCHMSSLAVCALLTRVGYEPVMQISCRDKNRIAIQGDILGGAAMGVCNLLCLTGDAVQAGDHPQAASVFDLDSISLLETARILRDERRFLSGRRLTDPPNVLLGAAENPFAPPQRFRAARLAKKVAAGAQFVQTRYCFDVGLLRLFMRRVEDLGLAGKIFIIVGVGPLSGAADGAREGRQICIDICQEIRTIPGVSGVHIMAYRQEDNLAEIVERSGVLAGRKPWTPGLELNEESRC